MAPRRQAGRPRGAEEDVPGGLPRGEGARRSGRRARRVGRIAAPTSVFSTPSDRSMRRDEPRQERPWSWPEALSRHGTWMPSCGIQPWIRPIRWHPVASMVQGWMPTEVVSNSRSCNNASPMRERERESIIVARADSPNPLMSSPSTNPQRNPSNAKSAWRSVSAASLTSLLDDAEGEPSPPPPSPKESEPVSTPPETPEPKSDDNGGESKEEEGEEEEETPVHYSEATSMMPTFPSYPPNPFAWILDRNLFTGPSRPKSYLAVSVLGVKNLHDGCEACRRRKPPGTSWSSLLSGLDPSKQKRGYTTRPYVRFVLGDHEHRTKITKFNGGNPSWKRRHRTSCLLPCPPEKNLWWFLGQEDQDLVVEVRNDWKRLPRKGDGAEADEGDEGDDGGDPVLAAATVPLSSVTIDKDDRARAGEGRELGRRRRVRSVRRNRAAAAAKEDGGSSSIRVTLPLRTRGCDRAPEGSVTLKITVREDESSSARRVPDDAPERLKKTVSFQRVKSSFRSNVSKIAGGHNPLRWSRKFDYRTRKWCALKPSSSRSSSASASLVSSSDESSYGYESSSDSISSSDSSSDSSEFRSRLFLKESSSEESYLLPL
ncbi:hypothetical protein ACHAWF_013322 [Thalassiosira exigua]